MAEPTRPARVWYQSFVHPVEQAPYIKRLQELLDSVAGPDFKFEVHGLDPPDLHFHPLTEFRCAAQTIRHALEAERAGYDAFVLSRLPAQTPSRLSYLRGAIGGLLQYRPPRFLIRNAGRAFDERLWVAFVANGRFCGNGMHVAPRARTDDGRLDVVAIAALHPARVLARLPKLYSGTIAADPAVRSFTTDRLHIDATPAASVQADGQLVGSTPAAFAIVPGALRVLIPARAPDA